MLKQTKQTIGLLVLSLLLSGCGVPSFEATEAQREADLEWIFSKFDRNYAPLEWKKQNLGVDFLTVKDECFLKNKSVTNNDEFRALVYECVSKFQDAHTSAMQVGQILPGKANVAYLGFLTRRTIINKADVLVVTKLLPTSEPLDLPVKVGDQILEVDGQSVAQHLLEQVSKYANLGLESANLTVAGERFAVRNSMEMALPAADDITLKVKRGADVFTVTLPWSKQDLFAFAKEQEDAVKKKVTSTAASEETKPEDTKPFHVPNFLDVLLGEAAKLVQNGQFTLSHIEWKLKNSFRIMGLEERDAAVRFVKRITAEEETNGVTRIFPGVQKKISHTWSALMDAREVLHNGKRLMYIRIAGFSMPEEAFAGLGELLIQYKTWKYDGIVLDLLDNGGGSLILGTRMLTMLSSKQLKLSKLEVALNDNWVDSFASEAVFGTSDATRTWARRISEKLEEDRAKNQRLSSALDISTLDNKLVNWKQTSCVDSSSPTSVCLKESTPIVLLVNEMCASMCDIFASQFKDNALGTVIGTQTMGAGGNVVMHVASPVSRFMLQQTESLVVDAQGQYLENKGVVPDVVVDTVSDRMAGYSATLLKAFETLAPSSVTP